MLKQLKNGLQEKLKNKQLENKKDKLSKRKDKQKLQ